MTEEGRAIDAAAAADDDDDDKDWSWRVVLIWRESSRIPAE